MKKDGIITEVFIFNLKWIREHSECKCCTLSSSNISTLCTAYYIPSLCAASEGFSAAPGIYTVIKPSCCNTLRSVNALFISLLHMLSLSASSATIKRADRIKGAPEKKQN